MAHGATFDLRRNHARVIADYDQALNLKPHWAGAYLCCGMAYAEIRKRRFLNLVYLIAFAFEYDKGGNCHEA